MKKLFMMVLLAAVFSPSAFGQGRKMLSATELIGTTWVVYWDELRYGRCGKNGKSNWQEHETITFSKNGKIMIDGAMAQGLWKFHGNKLTGSVENSIYNMDVTLNGNKMMGTGEVGMSNLVFNCLRLVRQP
jgi:hypothetical protein